MAEPTVRDLPLFPLPVVALPTEAVPLHIFEERYLEMVGACLERDSEFGIVWLSDEGLREIGCTARIEKVLERLDDGRMNILARGRSPFRILEHSDGQPYPAGVVELLADRDERPDSTLVASARAAYSDVVELATDRRPAPAEVSTLGAYAMAALLDLGLEAKQGLLGLRSENARLRLVTRLFRSAIERRERAERARERARGNGRVRFS